MERHNIGGEWGRGSMVEGTNPTKIYFKHMHKYQNLSLIQLLYANKIINKKERYNMP
jgi:hypothetical protein